LRRARWPARRYFEQAIGLAEDDAELASLREQAGRMAWLSADVPGSKEHYEAARVLFERCGDDRGVARALAGYGDVLRAEGRLEDAIKLMKEALEVRRRAAGREYSDARCPVGACRVLRGSHPRSNRDHR